MLIHVPEKNDAEPIYAEFCEIPQGQPLPVELEKVKVAAEISMEGKNAVVKGDVEAVIKTQCSRCLSDMQTTLRAAFDELFVCGGDGIDHYAYTGREICLDAMVLDAISMELPLQYLCKEDCKGLCPKCGANKNEAECGCDLRPEGSPFDVLKGMFEEK